MLMHISLAGVEDGGVNIKKYGVWRRRRRMQVRWWTKQKTTHDHEIVGKPSASLR